MVTSLAVGLVVGAIVRLLRRRIVDADAQIILSLITPYVAYISADRLGASGVLATVTAGLYVGWRTSGVVPATTRLRANTFWDVLVYLLNAVLFLLLEAEFTTVLSGLDRYSPWELAGYAAAAAATVITLRLAWMLAVPPTTARIRALGQRDVGLAPARQRLVVGWSGIRGAVSLAAALSVPLMARHRPFPGRSLVVFLTFCVILATLVLQGGSLPWVIRALGVSRGDRQSRVEAMARQRLAQAALARLDELTADESSPDTILDEDRLPATDVGSLREIYEDRLARASSRASAGSDRENTKDDAGDLRRREHLLNRAWREAVGAERAELQRLRRAGHIDNHTMLGLKRELDLDEARRQH
ncbi:MAG: cation:proton antiporter [Acidimicrobiales bacterium]